MTSLLDPERRPKGGIRWGLVAHTMVLFSVATAFALSNLNLQSVSYVDNREFPDMGDGFPGPFNWQFFVYNKPIVFFPSIMFIINTWLTDGLLVCSTIESPLRFLMRAVSLALPLLRHLRKKNLGRRLPMFDVPHVYWYVQVFPSDDLYQSNRYSYWYRFHLPGHAARGYRCKSRHYIQKRDYILFDFYLRSESTRLNSSHYGLSRMPSSA